MAEEVVLMKGNEAIAHAAIRCGADGYFGYPITPQSEVLETLAEVGTVFATFLWCESSGFLFALIGSSRNANNACHVIIREVVNSLLPK